MQPLLINSYTSIDSTGIISLDALIKEKMSLTTHVRAKERPVVNVIITDVTF